MTDKSNIPANAQKPIRSFPKLEKNESGEFKAVVDDDMSISRLMGMRTHEAAYGDSIMGGYA